VFKYDFRLLENLVERIDMDSSNSSKFAVKIIFDITIFIVFFIKFFLICYIFIILLGISVFPNFVSLMFVSSEFFKN
jgi:hypothetical protein